MKKKKQFYVVATPIGNMEDISAHALQILNEVDFIACEDTRVTKKLLDRYKISTNVFAYHKFNEKIETKHVLDLLNDGKTIALVSDAGTPCICDPGKILLQALYENNVQIESVSGCCAISTFLSLVPRCDEQFVFAGFLDKTFAKQKEVLQKYQDIDFVFYESPNRLLKTLQNIEKVRGSDAKIAVGRELTKIYEEIKVGTVKEIIDFYSSNVLKGEIVVMVYRNENYNDADIDVQTKVKTLEQQGFSKKDIVKILVSLYALNKNDLYKIVN